MDTLDRSSLNMNLQSTVFCSTAKSMFLFHGTVCKRDYRMVNDLHYCSVFKTT